MMIAEYWDYYLTGYDAPTGGMGTASVLPHDEPRNYGDELRQAFEDVTGQKIEAPAKARIGFV